MAISSSLDRYVVNNMFDCDVCDLGSDRGSILTNTDSANSLINSAPNGRNRLNHLINKKKW